MNSLASEPSETSIVGAVVFIVKAVIPKGFATGATLASTRAAVKASNKQRKVVIRATRALLRNDPRVAFIIVLSIEEQPREP
jgi:hypothetical protein